jgi:hypothetical protein
MSALRLFNIYGRRTGHMHGRVRLICQAAAYDEAAARQVALLAGYSPLRVEEA